MIHFFSLWEWHAYRGEQEFATKTVLLTTVISILTISLFAIIVEL